jgi:vancomycin resistance protein YoaR
MTATESPLPISTAIEVAEPARGLPRRRVVLSFALGIAMVLALAAGGVLAYENAHVGKVATGVHLGSVDLSGLTREEAAVRLSAAYAGFATGSLVVGSSAGDVTVTYGELGRKADVDRMLDVAFGVGRTGGPLERVVGEIRTLIRGQEIAPTVTFDRAALHAAIAKLAAGIDRPATSASAVLGSSGFIATPAVEGRTVDQAAAEAAIVAGLDGIDAPSQTRIELTVATLAPPVDDIGAGIAISRATRLAQSVVLAQEKDSWVIPEATVRGWVTFGTWPDGSYGPLADAAKVQASLQAMAPKVNRAPVSASFLVGKDNVVVGVTPARDGRALDVAGTVPLVEAALITRAKLGTDPKTPIVPAVTSVAPVLTTAEATKAAPLMKAISSWTTIYVPGSHNGYGANISIPAMAIDGTVLAPGERFSFWKTVGEVSLAKGYTLGGAIVDGHSVEGKTIGGGICSTSTTIFNAALRAGLEMGARANHYYYISRYPKGLDATVFITDGGGAQDMTFRNDTNYPILIRAYANSRAGIVRFTLYSVPTGRTVAFTNPIVKNYLPGYTVTQNTTSLAPGVRSQVEYAADGQDVWVTRFVRDASGKVIHTDNYYSHYARMIGVILVGQAPAPAPVPAPTP